jgi:hypothetical protein
MKMITPLHLWLKVSLQADILLLPWQPLWQVAQLQKITNISYHHHKYHHCHWQQYL